MALILINPQLSTAQTGLDTGKDRPTRPAFGLATFENKIDQSTILHLKPPPVAGIRPNTRAIRRKSLLE